MLERKLLRICEGDRNYSKEGFLEDVGEHFRLLLPVILFGRIEQNDTHALACGFYLFEANGLQQLLVLFNRIFGQPDIFFQRLLERERHGRGKCAAQ